MDLGTKLVTDAQKGGKQTKFANESYWKKSQQFFTIPSNYHIKRKA